MGVCHFPQKEWNRTSYVPWKSLNARASMHWLSYRKEAFNFIVLLRQAQPISIWQVKASQSTSSRQADNRDVRIVHPKSIYNQTTDTLTFPMLVCSHSYYTHHPINCHNDDFFQCYSHMLVSHGAALIPTVHITLSPVIKLMISLMQWSQFCLLCQLALLLYLLINFHSPKSSQEFFSPHKDNLPLEIIS